MIQYLCYRISLFALSFGVLSDYSCVENTNMKLQIFWSRPLFLHERSTFHNRSQLKVDRDTFTDLCWSNKSERVRGIWGLQSYFEDFKVMAPGHSCGDGSVSVVGESAKTSHTYTRTFAKVMQSASNNNTSTCTCGTEARTDSLWFTWYMMSNRRWDPGWL